MEARRLRAPAGDGEVLAVPALAESGDLLRANLDRTEGWDHDFQGRRASRLRPMARRDVLRAAEAHLTRFGLELPPPPDVDASWIVTGHQPELFHPGVWIKNFAVAWLARRHQGTAINLIVDNDLPKAAAIRVPGQGTSGPKAATVEFDNWLGDVPFERWDVRDEALFASFEARVRDALGVRAEDAILNEFWPFVRAASSVTPLVGLRFASARRATEQAWGVRNWDVPLSLVCETESFAWFASHLLAHLPRFQDQHNQALDAYRRLHRIRSRNHPVPALRRQGDWYESPFWAWRANAPRRQALWACQRDRSTLALRIGEEDRPFVELPLGPDRDACCAVERLLALPSQGISVRTRALTTTMFARVVLGDIFLHGIGGAKYDELGDEIVRRFFGIEPPGFLTLTMTTWLGLDQSPVGPLDLQRTERTLRDLSFNPDRYLKGPISDDVERLLLARRDSIAGPVSTRRERIERFRRITLANQDLQPAVEPIRAEWETRRDQQAAALNWNALARGREYSFVIHSRRRLRERLGAPLPGLFPG